jgi:serine protease AprX
VSEPAPASAPVSARDLIRANLTQTVIARPLLDAVEAFQANAAGGDSLHDLIIDPNLSYEHGREGACLRIEELVHRIAGEDRVVRYQSAHLYVFTSLTVADILELVRRDRAVDAQEVMEGPGNQRVSNHGWAIHRIWEDPRIEPLITNSLCTVKADAAHAAFNADGAGIVWAVIDSGIDQTHPHFHTKDWSNLAPLPAPIVHRDFTGASPEQPLVDEFGHGTHVAGIIAGQMLAEEKPKAVIRSRDSESGMVSTHVMPLDRDARGMAPRCKLLSLKVLRPNGTGNVSAVIEALAYIQTLNDFGRRVVVHGVNLSVGYAFKPEWFACGYSPVCVEVNRLVKSGVVVVVAAGNSGYGSIGAASGSISSAGLPLTINDPGNAELALTVGSTHRDMPHTYGVSYFSSKGPTGDGRMKPDLVAPGERILSCAAGKTRADAVNALVPDETGKDFQYVEDTGTSMAAPHVSGSIAAFLSIRREFIGQPEVVKKLFMDSAVDLKRDRSFQGSGLVDLLRAIQSV